MRYLLVISLLVAACFGSPAHAQEATPGLNIYWIDTLIVTPQRESILIDTGNPGFRDSDRIVRTATQIAGLRRIDHLIITHYHRDHFGGAAMLSTLLPIGTVYDNGKFAGMPDDPGEEYFRFRCEQRKVINPGDALELKQPPAGPPLSLRCLGTRQQFVAAPDAAAANDTICADHRPKDRDGSDNANSVVMLLDYGPFRFFDAGDLTWNQEYRLVCPHNLVGEVDVYQVTHHGLDSSNNPVVLRSLRPKVAIMNNGVTKGCLPEVFTTLSETSSLEAVYQVHKNLRPDGDVNNVPDEYIANLPEKCDGNIIQLAVSPDGKKYSVTIPANGHSRTYQTKVKP
jgi:competence protein ComEC